MTIYEEMAALAVEMLDEFGMYGTLSRKSDAFDKKTGRRTSDASTSQPIRTLVQDREVESDDGRTVIRTVAYLLVKPQIQDTLTLGNRSWQVSKVTEVQPTDTPIIYFAELA